jgi:hypothetical protein
MREHVEPHAVLVHHYERIVLGAEQSKGSLELAWATARPASAGQVPAIGGKKPQLTRHGIQHHYSAV